MNEMLLNAVDRVERAWEEFRRFGDHDGPCDNPERCPNCGGATKACSIHLRTTAERQGKMNAVLFELISLARNGESD